MSSFDLSQALESSPESDDTGFESRCFNMTDVQEEVFKLDEGLSLVVSRDPVTMDKVATLLLAVNRMKKSLTRCRELSGDKLCSVILDSLVEETIVKTTVNWSMEIKKIFQRLNSVEQGTLCDTLKKDVVHDSEECKLQAVTLKGGHGERKVNFRLSKYSPLSPAEGEPVVLSITNNNLHISCSMEKDKAVLSLENCSENDLNSISDDGDLSRFLFYRTARELSLNTFESVKCRGWFISTYEDDDDLPVEMCQVGTAQRLIRFEIN